MPIDDRTYELIDLYLNGEMNAGEALAFEKRIASETELAEAVQLEKALAGGVRHAARKEMRSQLDNLHENFFGQGGSSEEAAPTSDPKVKNIAKYWYWAAAAVVALLVASVVILDQGNEGPEKLVSGKIDYVYEAAGLGMADSNVNRTVSSILISIYLDEKSPNGVSFTFNEDSLVITTPVVIDTTGMVVYQKKIGAFEGFFLQMEGQLYDLVYTDSPKLLTPGKMP